MIKLQLIGNLGKDCVVNNVNGRSVINFNVAHTERYKDAQGVQKDRTIWVDCAYWTDKTAISPYLKKGQTVYVEGQPDVRAYTTSDGRQGATLTLRVQQVQLVGGQRTQDGQPQQSGTNTYSTPQNTGMQDNSSQPPSIAAADLNAPSDDLPF